MDVYEAIMKLNEGKDELLNDEKLTFGKYRGMTPNQLVRIDPSYLAWAYRTVGSHLCSERLYKQAKEKARATHRGGMWSKFSDEDGEEFGCEVERESRFHGCVGDFSCSHEKEEFDRQMREACGGEIPGGLM